MNTSGEVADLMVKEAIQISESAVKLAGLGAKNLAALLIALSQDSQKTQGKTNIQKLIKEGKQLCIMQVKQEDLQKFNKEAKQYGVLFSAIVDKTQNTGLVDIIAKHEDIGRLNYIMEKLGCPVPTNDEVIEDKDDLPKKAQTRAKEKKEQKNSSAMHGNGLKEMLDTEQTAEKDKKQSVKTKIETFKNEKKQPSKKMPKKDKSR